MKRWILVALIALALAAVVVIVGFTQIKLDALQEPGHLETVFATGAKHLERQLRPAVIARKVSCGNKTQRRANLAISLAATCAQRATSFIAALARAAPLQAR